jgi:hypothetical protein
MIPGVTPEYCGKSNPLSGRFEALRYVEHSPM